MPRERPIIFSGPIVNALLRGEKTQTRRVVKPGAVECPYGKPGDTLWVREQLRWRLLGGGRWVYVADDASVIDFARRGAQMYDWMTNRSRDYCPSIHMPRWASRVTLEITATRKEPLQDISEEDALAEGFGPHWDGLCWPGCSKDLSKDLSDARHPSFDPSYRASFGVYWDSLHPKEHRWADNDPVWVVGVRRIEP
jgi:hypothetical protein